MLRSLVGSEMCIRDRYRNGPSLLLNGADIFTCVVGQSHRHGFFGTAWNVTLMCLIMPWVKYWWNANPWVYDLEERYVQQISTSMADLAQLHSNHGANKHAVEHGICDTTRRIISRSKQFGFLRKSEDLWNFAPHYPYPPDDRRWAVGMQAGGSASAALKYTLLVHTTHAISDAGGSTEQFVLSNSVHSPVYRVMLWYSNPFHFLTGWVEASISNGGISQPNKWLGGEHPMWLVTARSPFLSARDSYTGSGMIDEFFDNWLPIFVHECRRLTHMDYEMLHNGCSVEQAYKIAGEVADREYQEVITRVRAQMGGVRAMVRWSARTASPCRTPESADMGTAMTECPLRCIRRRRSGPTRS
eukprot:TRINITY_DN12483_c0_g4_i7.p1 TRINITY_DN12483_c0_g4~~TRINITY_DN12483_c0_g4_i7.p1  ORF type:complete len:373 (+),score=86.29 TRINITY_DN12483_c0_g4_i7:46-1119(+)